MTPRVMLSRNCWELITDSLENLPHFLQKESHVLYTLTPIYLQNNTFPVFIIINHVILLRPIPE